MGVKTLLVADADGGAGKFFQEALGPEWEVNSFTDGQKAMTELKRRDYDMVVAGLDVGDASAAELLNYTRRKHPTIPRFILASEADKMRAMKEGLGAHQFLTKPLDRALLKQTVDRALNLDVWLGCEDMRALVTRVRSFPTAPAVYLELLGALRSPGVTIEEVATIISRDMAISAKLLQVVNSAYFGYGTKLTDLTEVVGLLGFETVKSLATAIKMLAHYDRIKLPNYSIEELWAHSNEVARIARQITLECTGDRAMAESAFLAGLLHDIGKVVLAANFAQQYSGVQALAAKQSLPAWVVEKEIFGATHGEVGAFLLGLWGMPMEILEATAFHHDPSRDRSQGFTVLTAVHAANALHYESHSSPDVRRASIDEAYLSRVGVLECLPVWRTAAGISQPECEPSPNQVPSGLSPNPPPTITENAAEQPLEIISAPVTMPSRALTPVVAPFPRARRRGNLRRHVARCGVAFAVMIFAGVLAWWNAGNRASNNPDLPVVFARTALEPAKAALPAATEPEALSAKIESPGPKAPQEALFTEESGKGAAPKHAAADVALPAAIGPVQLAANPQTQAVTRTPEEPSVIVNALPAKPEPPVFPELKLQGLILRKSNSEAILNGKTLAVNDRLGDVRVIAIGVSNVTVEYKNQVKTLTLGGGRVKR